MSSSNVQIFCRCGANLSNSNCFYYVNGLPTCSNCQNQWEHGEIPLNTKEIVDGIEKDLKKLFKVLKEKK